MPETTRQLLDVKSVQAAFGCLGDLVGWNEGQSGRPGATLSHPGKSQLQWDNPTCGTTSLGLLLTIRGMVLQVEKIWKRSNTSHCHNLPLTILSSPQAGRFSLGDTGGMLNMVGDGSLELADQDTEVCSQNRRNVTCQINGLILATVRIHGPGRGNNHKLLWMSGIKTTEPQTTWCCTKKNKMAHTT